MEVIEARVLKVCSGSCVIVFLPLYSHHPLPPLHRLPQHLYDCATAGDIPGMLCALVHGANVNFINEADEGRSPLIQTIHSGSLGATEFLMLNGVRPNLRDSLGRGVLHHCVLQGAST